ncbi:hypothetical protein ABZP36_024877 [Zizania latifolia]
MVQMAPKAYRIRGPWGEVEVVFPFPSLLALLSNGGMAPPVVLGDACAKRRLWLLLLLLRRRRRRRRMDPGGFGSGGRSEAISTIRGCDLGGVRLQVRPDRRRPRRRPPRDQVTITST